MDEALAATIIARIDAIDTKLTAHMQREDNTLDHLANGAPGGDWEGHRRYHEAIIEKQQWRARLYRDLVAHVAKYGAISVITVFFAWIAWSMKHWLER